MTCVRQSAVVMALITSKANIDARDSVPPLLLWPLCEQCAGGPSCASQSCHCRIRRGHWDALGRCVIGVAGSECDAGGAV